MNQLEVEAFMAMTDLIKGWGDLSARQLEGYGMSTAQTLKALTRYAQATGRWKEVLHTRTVLHSSPSHFRGWIYAKLGMLEDLILRGDSSPRILVWTLEYTPLEKVPWELEGALRSALAKYILENYRTERERRDRVGSKRSLLRRSRIPCDRISAYWLKLLQFRKFYRLLEKHGTIYALDRLGVSEEQKVLSSLFLKGVCDDKRLCLGSSPSPGGLS